MQSPEFLIRLAQVTERGLFFYVHMIKYCIKKYWKYWLLFQTLFYTESPNNLLIQFRKIKLIVRQNWKILCGQPAPRHFFCIYFMCNFLIFYIIIWFLTISRSQCYLVRIFDLQVFKLRINKTAFSENSRFKSRTNWDQL